MYVVLMFGYTLCIESHTMTKREQRHTQPSRYRRFLFSNGDTLHFDEKFALLINFVSSIRNCSNSSIRYVSTQCIIAMLIGMTFISVPFFLFFRIVILFVQH